MCCFRIGFSSSHAHNHDLVTWSFLKMSDKHPRHFNMGVLPWGLSSLFDVHPPPDRFKFNHFMIFFLSGMQVFTSSFLPSGFPEEEDKNEIAGF